MKARKDARDTRFFPKNTSFEQLSDSNETEGEEVFEPQESLPLTKEETPTEKE